MSSESPEISEILVWLISKRLSVFNPFSDGSFNIEALPLNSIQRSLGSFAKGEKSEITVFHALIPSKLSIPASAETSDTGLPSIPSPFNLLNPANGDKSLISFSSRPSQSTLIKPLRGEISVILLSRSLMLFRCLKSANGERSDIALWRNSIRSSFIAYSSPRKSLMPFSSASRRVNRAMSAAFSEAPAGFPNASAIAARRFASGTRLLGSRKIGSGSGIGIGSGSGSGVGIGQSSPYRHETISSKLSVHASRFTFPPLNKPTNPKLCKPAFSRITFTNAAASNPTDAAACDASNAS